MKYHAVLFDLDGTLLDTLADLSDSMNAALTELGLRAHEQAEYKYFVGDGVVELARRVLPADRCDEASLRAAAERMRAEYARRWNVKTRPYDGVPELLDGLTERGVRKGVLSNKPHDFTLLCVSKLLAKWTFDVVQGVEEGVRKKPDPSGALAVARKLGLKSEQFLYVGDTNTDMQTAVAAGMYPVGALWGFRTAEELLANGAKTLLARPEELLKLL
jgi:phosphoglycolate phosphatase